MSEREMQLQAILQQRSMQNFGEMVDGLSFAIAGAEAGDKNAQQLVRGFREALKRVESLPSGSGLVIPQIQVKQGGQS
jgi:hypothetical protein